MRGLLRLTAFLQVLFAGSAAALLFGATVHLEAWRLVPARAQLLLRAVPAEASVGWPLALGWACARAFALMPSWRWLSRSTALRFSLVTAGAALALAPALLRSGTAGRVALGALLLSALLEAAVGLFAREHNEPGPVLLDADAVGSHTTLLWFLQGGVALVLGALLVARASLQVPDVAALLRPGHARWGLLWGVLLLGLGALSWLGAGPQKVHPGRAPHASWQRFAFLFALSFGALGLAPLVGGTPFEGLLRQPAPLLPRALAGVVGVGFSLANGALLLRQNWLGERMEWVRRYLRVFWVGEWFFCIALGVLWFVMPERVARNLSELPDPGKDFHALHALGVDGAKLLGSFVLGVSGAVLLGIGRGESVHRRLVARALAVWHVSWLAIVYYNMSGHFGRLPSRYSLAGVLGSIPVAFFAVPNVLASVEPHKGPRAILETGDADTRPSWLLPFWATQGLLSALVAALAVSSPEFIARQLLNPNGPCPTPQSWELDQLRIQGSYFAFLAALSWLSMLVVSPWLWRTIARFFVGFSALLLFSYVVVYNLIVYQPLALLAHAGFLTMLLGNLWLLRHKPAVEDLGIPREPRGLAEGDLLVAAPMAAQVLQKRRRASHLYGVGAAGLFEVTVPGPESEDFPHNEFFHRHRGRQLPLTMRFANLTFEDDASLDVRGAALRLGAERDRERFDLVFNTGSFAPPSNLVEFAQFVLSKWAPSFLAKRVIEANPFIFEGGVAGLRRAPESYALLRYYSQLVRIWVGVRGPVPAQGATLPGPHRMYLVRYRLVPEALLREDGSVDYARETGLPDQTDQAALWRRGRRPDERRPKDYLRKALAQALARGEAVRFLLQAQLHEAQEPAGKQGEALAWYNASVDWDELTCPWRTLGRITLTQALSERETERLWFNPGLHPFAMGVPASPGPTDYRSLADAEVRVMRLASRLREWLYRWGGTP